MTTSPAGQAGSLVLDAEALYRELLRGVRSMLTPTTRLAGIASGGAWLAERLQKDLGLEGPAGVLSSVMHRDDFAQRGLATGAQTALPFDVDGADVLVLDDVLIGLDHSNRLPMLDVLKTKFADWQIVLLTHDRNWFDLARSHLPDANWKCVEVYEGDGADLAGIVGQGTT